MTTRKKPTRPAKTTTATTTTANAMPEPDQPETPQNQTPLGTFANAVPGARSAYLALAGGRGWGEIPLDQRQEIQRITKWLADMHLR